MNLTLTQTKQLIKANKKYIDGGIFSWREAQAIINQNLVVKNDVCVNIPDKEIQTKLNQLLTDPQKGNNFRLT